MARKPRVEKLVLLYINDKVKYLEPSEIITKEKIREVF